MAICEKCGKEYLTRECLRCKNKTENNFIERPLNEKDKLYKTIRYAILFFIGIIILGVIGDVIIASYFIKKTSPMVNNLNKMTYDAMKANKKLMDEINKGFKIPHQNR